MTTESYKHLLVNTNLNFFSSFTKTCTTFSFCEETEAMTYLLDFKNYASTSQ